MTRHRGPDQFWSKARKGDGCWEWTGFVAKRTGYGQARYQMGKWLAHRLAWTLTHGEIPEGMQVCHDCDNRRCVNPAHLFLGSATDNVHDMLAKGRERNPVAERGKAMTACGRGHPFTPENTRVNVNGSRECRTCCRDRYHGRYRDKAIAAMRDRYYASK